jgi:hypothetical protein
MKIMIITMQGNWNVRVKAKNAAFPQRFVISGATSGNGTYVVGAAPTPAPDVTGSQWTIAIQHNPGGGFQLSDAKLKFPVQVGGNYQFDIESNDTGADQDFDDLILTCSRPATPNDFIIYGNVSLYSGRCVFNPCRKDIFVIESKYALQEALKNSRLRDVIEKLYPQRVPPFKVDPNPPDPPYFTPLVIDLFGEAMQPKTTVNVSRIADDSTTTKASAKNASAAESSFKIEEAVSRRSIASDSIIAANKFEIGKAIDSFYRFCRSEPGYGLNLVFEEYDRTIAEQAGGPYTGTGNRRLLGDTVTDMFGNYIFSFKFDMTFPFLEDETDDFPGQTPSTYAYPDVIVKVVGSAPWQVLYESAPYFNIPNLKRINLCLPKGTVRLTSSCVNDNLIGSLGNVALGGAQNTTASFSNTALTRDDFGNRLDKDGIVSVSGSEAQFNVQCASWGGVVDIIGCIYDETKPLADNKIRWYTIRIKRKGTAAWTFVSENYQHQIHPTGQGIVGSFPQLLMVDGGAAIEVPAYKSMKYELHAGITNWKSSNIDTLIQLNTGLYDQVAGVHTPGTFYVRIDAYDAAGNLLAGQTDMIALYIHNKDLKFGLTSPRLDDPAIVDAGCGLFRLRDDENNTPMKFSFMANDVDGFVDNYNLTMSRCPGSTIALQVSPNPPLSNTLAGATTLSAGTSGSVKPTCNGYTGTEEVFGTDDLVELTLLPGAGETGWIKVDEYFTIYSVSLTAQKRVTNGYNSGLSSVYYGYGQLLLEKLNP